jgi:hypothetical protein
MDPEFLRQAVNDMVATTDAEGPQVPSVGDVLKASALRCAAALGQLRQRIAASAHRA